EVEAVCLFQLREVSVQARTLCEQFENAALIEDVDVVLPDHVIDGRESLSVADQSRRKAGKAIVHDCLPEMDSGMGTASANPARYTGCAKFSGATSLAAPRGSEEETRTDPSATMRVVFFKSPVASTR